MCLGMTGSIHRGVGYAVEPDFRAGRDRRLLVQLPEAKAASWLWVIASALAPVFAPLFPWASLVLAWSRQLSAAA